LPRPKNGDPDTILEKKAWAGLKKRGFDKSPEYRARLEEELRIIKQKNFSTYFLIVSNMISWAREQGILVGPGRGSSAGSLLCYSLRITEVDPIEYGLLFFRFLDVDRNDWPDIDVDFQKSRRGEVKDYLRRQFKHVAEILTINNFQGKNAVKAAARCFMVPQGEVNKATKPINTPSDKPHLFWPAFEKSELGAKFAADHPEVMELAKLLSGRISNVGKHPAGIVMANSPLVNFVPVETANDPDDKDGPRVPVVAMDMREAEKVGLVKIDALGLKTLDVLADIKAAVKERHGQEFVLEDIPLDDPLVYELLSRGDTRGIFQAEGSTFTKWIKETGASEFNDLVIGTSIARPGPKETVGEIFKRRKAGEEAVTYTHESMKAFTEETLGVIVYQEQVMLAMTELAGMSMSTANKVRKIIGKKLDREEFLPYMEEFVEGAAPKVGRAVAEKLWHDFEAHAGYSFNKSHAVVYSMLTYWTAWFKVHYPTEFAYSILKNGSEGTDAKDKMTEYLMEAKRMGLKVLLPHVNKSDLEFKIEDQAIRFGLINVKHIAEKSGKALIHHRPYDSYAALQAIVAQKNSGVNSKQLEGLNAVGAAVFPDNPLHGEERSNFYEYLGIPAFAGRDLPERITHQIVPMDEYMDKGCFVVMGMVRKVVRKDHWARVEVLDETDVQGIFDGYHTPIEAGQMYAILVADNSVMRFVRQEDIVPGNRNTFVQFLASQGYPDITDGFYRVVAFKSRTTKAGKKMADVVFCDAEKNMFKAIVFPSQFMTAYTKCQEGATVMVDFGKTDDGTLVVQSVS
jgi:DNA polymerase-3 subunit alpha